MPETLFPATPQTRHSWKFVGLRGGGGNVCARCGLVVTNHRNQATNHFEVRYHHAAGLTPTAGKCTPPA